MAHKSPATLKKNLPSILSDMQTASHSFVKQPGKDFAENGKLPFLIQSASF